MTRTVWVSGAMRDPRQMRPLTNDISENDIDRAIAIHNRNVSGEPLAMDCFPESIWPSKYSKSNSERMPDLFFAGSYWAVSESCADVLRRFDLGKGALYPVNVLKKDRKTLVTGRYFCLNFGNTKHSFVAGESPTTREFPGDRRIPPYVLHDGDIAIEAAALSGPDIWIEPKLFDAFFVSGPLGDALKAAKVSRWFDLKACRLIEA